LALSIDADMDQLLRECGVVEVSATKEVVENGLHLVGAEIPLGDDFSRFDDGELSHAEPFQQIALGDLSLDCTACVVLVVVVIILVVVIIVVGRFLPCRPPGSRVV
jgi:hypothetical protein